VSSPAPNTTFPKPEPRSTKCEEDESASDRKNILVTEQTKEVEQTGLTRFGYRRGESGVRAQNEEALAYPRTHRHQTWHTTIFVQRRLPRNNLPRAKTGTQPWAKLLFDTTTPSRPGTQLPANARDAGGVEKLELNDVAPRWRAE